MVSLVPVVSLHLTADIFKFLKNKLSADSINSVIHADKPTSIENSIKMTDGADQEQKEDVIQHHRLLENHVSISQEGQVNHTHSVTLCYSPTCSLLSDIKIGLHDPVHLELICGLELVSKDSKTNDNHLKMSHLFDYLGSTV